MRVAHPERLTQTQARRIALAAQGFADRRPARPDARALARVVDAVALFQINSVNVLTRAHYMPLFSRLGPYPKAMLDRAHGRAPRRMFEYWAHEASLVRVDLHPALRFRMARAHVHAWGGMRRLAAEQPELVAWVLNEVRANGPVTAREINYDSPRDKDNWGWNWSAVKTALEWHFFSGTVTAVRRNTAFERVYDLPERALPASVLHAPTPDVAESHRTLIRAAARALGVGSEQCLRDYFRLAPAETRAAISDLVDSGELLPVEITGWRRLAYLSPGARMPRQVSGPGTVSPFDSLVFERARTEALFGFRYRIEIYVPAHLRVHGYYVLPFLLGDRLVARVDLKADRKVGLLYVQAAHGEPHAPPETAMELAQELTTMAEWLDLDGVHVAGAGDLAQPLSDALSRP